MHRVAVIANFWHFHPFNAKQMDEAAKLGEQTRGTGALKAALREATSVCSKT